tara:strand:+ start:1093 stop:1380 length:288 start_codon:yes stop_codon:yes gene_type:complete
MSTINNKLCLVKIEIRDGESEYLNKFTMELDVDKIEDEQYVLETALTSYNGQKIQLCDYDDRWYELSDDYQLYRLFGYVVVLTEEQAKVCKELMI